MTYEAFQDRAGSNEWRVEAIDFEGEGACFAAIFVGAQAEGRAREYADWKNAGNGVDPRAACH